MHKFIIFVVAAGRAIAQDLAKTPHFDRGFLQ